MPAISTVGPITLSFVSRADELVRGRLALRHVALRDREVVEAQAVLDAEVIERIDLAVPVADELVLARDQRIGQVLDRPRIGEPTGFDGRADLVAREPREDLRAPERIEAVGVHERRVLQRAAPVTGVEIVRGERHRDGGNVDLRPVLPPAILGSEVARRLADRGPVETCTRG